MVAQVHGSAFPGIEYLKEELGLETCKCRESGSVGLKFWREGAGLSSRVEIAAVGVDEGCGSVVQEERASPLEEERLGCGESLKLKEESLSRSRRQRSTWNAGPPEQCPDSPADRVQ